MEPITHQISDAQRRSANRVLAIIVAVTVLLIATAAILTTTRETKTLSPDSPEGVVQLYLENVINGKNDLAAKNFASDSLCNASDIDRAYFTEDFRVSLVNTEITGDRAYVKIDVNYSSGGPFDSGYSEIQNYRLIKESGAWKITGIPWPLYDCGVTKK